MSHAKPLQRPVLEIAHDGIELHHGVGDRGPSREGDTPASCDLIQVLAFHEHVRTFLRVGLGDTCYITHLCVEEGVFVKMALVHKEAVHTELFKGHDVVLALLVVQLCQSHFQGLAGLFHLLDRVVLPPFVFHC